MKDRCTNPNNDKFEHYGGRGIDFDPRWRSFEVFLSDMGERPERRSLDRIDNSRGYWPDNCRWATQSEQTRNRRCAISCAYSGKEWALPDLAAHLGLKPSTLHSRVARGWPEEMLGVAPDVRNRAP